MLFGGLFLLLKPRSSSTNGSKAKTAKPDPAPGRKFWPVVAQIVVLDAVFSLDSVITAVGMVDHLAVMMAAVIIAITLMVMASKALTRFVNSHPTIVILCLSFLLMIGFSLVADGFGFHIPKGYLYAAIGFSVMIERLTSWRFSTVAASCPPIRPCASAPPTRSCACSAARKRMRSWMPNPPLLADHSDNQIFNPQERLMIERVLNLNQRSVSSIMTSRHDIEHIDLTAPEAQVRALLDKTSTPAWWSPAVKMKKTYWAWCTLLTFSSSSYGESARFTRAGAPAAGVPGDVAVALCWSSSVMRAPTLPLWWMSLVRLKGWSRSAT
jgi:CBS domain containing-hemolysin-like protein